MLAAYVGSFAHGVHEVAPCLLGVGERPTMSRDVTAPAQRGEILGGVGVAAPMQRNPVVNLQRSRAPTAAAAPPGGLQRPEAGLRP